jgi:serine/threonine protein kinase
MKVMKKNFLLKKGHVDRTFTERAILAKMKHPFIVPLKYAFQNEKKVYLVMKYCPGGELFFHLHQST